MAIAVGFAVMTLPACALRGDEYVLETEIRAGNTLTASQPYTISFDPGSLTELE